MQVLRSCLLHIGYGTRVFYKSFAAVAITILLYGTYLLVGVFLAGTLRRYRLNWRNIIIQLWGKALLRIIRAQLNITGNLPQHKPIVLVSNHLSYVDILVYCALFCPVFIAKAEIASWPIIGHLCRSFSVLFINRKSIRQSYKLQQQLYQVYKTPHSIVFFPEGTSTDGTAVQPFKPLLFHWLANQQIAVYGAFLHYQAPAGYDAREDICWWRPESGLISHLLRLLRMPSFIVHVDFAHAPLQHQDHKLLAQEAHQTVVYLQQHRADGLLPKNN